MDPYAAAYVDSRTRIVEMVHHIGASKWELPSPLTPGWRNRDLLGHLAGAVRDLKAGRFPTPDMSEWTAAQVAATKDEPLIELADEWASSGIEAMIDKNLAQMVLDVITHEFDIRYGLNIPGNASSEGVKLSARWVRGMFRGEHPVIMVIDGERHEWPGTYEGTSLEPIEVHTTSFQLLRAVTGRRSWNQIVAMGWTGPLDVIRNQLFGSGFFAPQPFDVLELTS